MMSSFAILLAGFKRIQCEWKMILVIDGTGEVGGTAVAELLSRGAAVRALVRSKERAAPLAKLGAELALGNLSDPSPLIGAMGGVESVLPVSPLDLRQVELQHHLVKAAKRGGAEHVVKLSGLGTALDSPIRSGRWHAETEAEIEASGLKWTFLRPLFFFQNLLRMAHMTGSLGVLPTPPAWTHSCAITSTASLAVPGE